MDKKTKILFTRRSFKPFIRRDLNILKKHFDVRVVRQLSLKNPISLLRRIPEILWADVTFSWFASHSTFFHVLLSKIFGKKSIVVSGGGDAAKMPEIGHGAVLSPIKRPFIWGTYLFADKVLAFSNSSKENILERMPETNVEPIYLGAIDTEKFRPGRKKDLIITVGEVIKSNLKRKGLETFVKTAKHLPDKQFVLIGEHKDDSIDYLKSIATSNVEFTGWLPFEDLLRYMQRAKVYVQVSAYEGFGIAMAEAMACECVPVVTNRGAIPEVVGETGFYVSYGDPEATAEAIKKALKSDKGKKARIRIKEKFHIKNREQNLTEAIGGL
ncbi:hypothetical protein AKJ48_03005 [candidate division MSBL1 archaeon SCGC-AAA261O19]|uniref:Glycosyl transferase family 1 domain-containing protein n=1 Tax=candidate division MSBL1 archaeon SCGC-AAA261O19 TaxID=1698277 RepID=A0A133VCY8_9EURY|nr:hypothetical protein AKJ48_03005 [candidate division MSBL1 archaeon SCGC-AAA261O19]